MANKCLVNSSGDKVSIHLDIDNGGQSGGKFWLWKKNGSEYEPIEKLDGSTNPQSGKLSLEISTEVSSLNETIMTWSILSCARIASATDLIIKVSFYQDENKLKTTSEIRYSNEYPKCDSGDAMQNSGEVTFVLFNETSTRRLWANMD